MCGRMCTCVYIRKHIPTRMYENIEQSLRRTIEGCALAIRLAEGGTGAGTGHGIGSADVSSGGQLLPLGGSGLTRHRCMSTYLSQVDVEQGGRVGGEPQEADVKGLGLCAVACEVQCVPVAVRSKQGLLRQRLSLHRGRIASADARTTHAPTAILTCSSQSTPGTSSVSSWSEASRQHSASRAAQAASRCASPMRSAPRR